MDLLRDEDGGDMVTAPSRVSREGATMESGRDGAKRVGETRFGAWLGALSFLRIFE
jgi:hypothetical protein